MTGTEPIALARFEPARLDELVLMWRASFEAGVGVTDPHSIAQQRDYFVGLVLPQHEVWVALHGALLVGFVAASRESVAQLHVRVGAWRQGIGTALLDGAKQRSGGSLWLYAFARNLGARAFYARNGFAEIEHGFEPAWQLDDVKLRWAADGR